MIHIACFLHESIGEEFEGLYVKGHLDGFGRVLFTKHALRWASDAKEP